MKSTIRWVLSKIISKYQIVIDEDDLIDAGIAGELLTQLALVISDKVKNDEKK